MSSLSAVWGLEAVCMSTLEKVKVPLTSSGSRAIGLGPLTHAGSRDATCRVHLSIPSTEVVV